MLSFLRTCFRSLVLARSEIGGANGGAVALRQEYIDLDHIHSAMYSRFVNVGFPALEIIGKADNVQSVVAIHILERKILIPVFFLFDDKAVDGSASVECLVKPGANIPVEAVDSLLQHAVAKCKVFLCQPDRLGVVGEHKLCRIPFKNRDAVRIVI